MVEAGILTQEQLRQALEIQKRKGGKLGQILIELGWVTEKLITDLVSQQRNFLRIQFDLNDLSPDVLKLIPTDICRKYRLIPYKIENNSLIVAMDDPMNYEAIERAEFVSGYRVTPAIVEPSKIDEALLRLSEAQEILPTRPAAVSGEAKAETEKEIQTNIVNFVRGLLLRGLEFGASDMHIEADTEQTYIRYRIHGVLKKQYKTPSIYHDNIISRLKMMCGLDPSVRDTVQTGGFRVSSKDKKYSLKVVFVPTAKGENAVVSFPSAQPRPTSLDKLGLTRAELSVIAEALSQPKGLVLLCGPRESGKTTTAYAMLRRVNNPEKKITTVEDPVEELLPLVNQIGVDRSSGFDFPEALEAALKLAPDIIYVSEISDPKTAELALRSAYVGTLVIAAVCATNSFEALMQLHNLGIEPFMLVSTVNLVVAQRLVRKLCPHCKTQTEVEGILLYHPKGCDHCAGTGYVGYTGVFELVPKSFITTDLFTPTPSLERMLQRAKSEKIETLWQKAMKKVWTGETSLDEVMRVVPKTQIDE